ncbi:K7_Fsp2-1ap, partial [Saccharomyces cerevisiae Kyokai no. 7]
MTISSAHPET